MTPDEKINNLLESAPDPDIEPYLAESSTEPLIYINDNRDIMVPDELKDIAVQHDHNIETVIFDCPRYWDEHDMFNMNVYINYRIPDGTLGCFLATNKNVDPNDSNRMRFNWTISRNVSVLKGKIQFLVCTKYTNEKGIQKLHWNSHLCDSMYVSEGLECSETIASDYPDIIDQLVNMNNHKIPSGGVKGQVLAKKSGVDYDTEWKNQNIMVVVADVATQTTDKSSSEIIEHLNKGGVAILRFNVFDESVPPLLAVGSPEIDVVIFSSLSTYIRSTNGFILYNNIVGVSGNHYENFGENYDYSVDSVMSDTSTNPVQNKVAKEYTDQKVSTKADTNYVNTSFLKRQYSQEDPEYSTFANKLIYFDHTGLLHPTPEKWIQLKFWNLSQESIVTVHDHESTNYYPICDDGFNSLYVLWPGRALPKSVSKSFTMAYNVGAYKLDLIIEFLQGPIREYLLNITDIHNNSVFAYSIPARTSTVPHYYHIQIRVSKGYTVIDYAEGEGSNKEMYTYQNIICNATSTEKEQMNWLHNFTFIPKTEGNNVQKDCHIWLKTGGGYMS